MNAPQPSAAVHRAIDADTLKGLAHPLRMQLLEALATYGPATSCGLGERLGESSGSTSYHLRQLEKHGFVREDATRGNARDRWWERVPDALVLNITDFEPNSAERIIAQTIEREWDRSRAATLDEFNNRGPAELPKDWYEESAINTINMQLTLDEMKQFVADIEAVTKRWVVGHKKAKPGSRPVQVHVNAFPVMDGIVTPDGPSDASRNVGGTA